MDEQFQEVTHRSPGKGERCGGPPASGYSNKSSIGRELRGFKIKPFPIEARAVGSHEKLILVRIRARAERNVRKIPDRGGMRYHLPTKFAWQHSGELFVS